jgi:hypothetical protein
MAIAHLTVAKNLSVASRKQVTNLSRFVILTIPLRLTWWLKHIA